MSSMIASEFETKFEVYLALSACSLRTTLLLATTNDEDTDPCDVCTCDEVHSVAKLGHCRDCEAFRPLQATMVEPDLASGAWLCRSAHIDGSGHDFEWATYSDDTSSYGVCRCGYDGMTHALMTFP